MKASMEVSLKGVRGYKCGKCRFNPGEYCTLFEEHTQFHPRIAASYTRVDRCVQTFGVKLRRKS